MLDGLVKAVIENQTTSGNHIDWEITQVIKNMSDDEVLEFAIEHDEWAGTKNETYEMAQKIISGEAKVMTISDVKSGFFPQIKSAVKQAMKK